MSRVPKTLVKSREFLQSLSSNRQEIVKYEVFDTVLLHIWADIVKPQMFTVKYTMNLCDEYWLAIMRRVSHEGIVPEAIRLELMGILKKEYPGCDIRYSEGHGYDGKIIQRLIVIDWS